MISMSNKTSPIRVGVRCHPINTWATTAENGMTFWHGYGIHYLEEFAKYWGFEYEFVQIPPGTEGSIQGRNLQYKNIWTVLYIK